jgi:hypothetical protein
MNPTSRVSVIASPAGEKSQTNGPEHTTVSSILTDLFFQRSNGNRRTIEPVKQPSSSNEFQILNIFILDSYKLKTKRMSLIY